MRLESIWKGLVYAAEEMGSVLRRTAVSPNIRDRLDFSCAILDPEGRLVAQAEHIPVHLGVLAYSGPRLVEEIHSHGFEEGDVFVSNDPYMLGTHLNDVTLVKPVFYSGRLIAWLAVKAHHVDVGGRAPGSIGGASRIDEEGVLIHLERLVERGVQRFERLSSLITASRTPDALKMDLHAQLAALKWGESLLAGLAERYGADALLDAMRWSLEYVKRYAGRVFGGLEGRAEFSDWLEDDEGAKRVETVLEVYKGHVRVYLRGPRQLPKAVNATLPSTVAAVAYTLKAVLDPDMPVNYGLYEKLSVNAEEGSVFNAVPPAPVSAYTETVQRVVDLVQGALAELAPGRVPAASGGSMTSIAMGGEGWAFYETIGCGSGARPDSDGVDGVHVNMTNTLNTPIEILENQYPIRIEAYELRNDSCGLGKWRGGLGIRRVYRALRKTTVSIAGSRVWTKPWGLEGGEPGARAEYKIIRKDGRVELLPPLAVAKLEPGDLLVIETPGGGGYGNPCERKREHMEADVREGKVSLERVELLQAECTRQ
ncbi:5-oxoprolinase (ATP-hydrolyzing) [Pyrolobus fumarii 1A]|uniref:5-oxoprolinase (ATP-hydrolyzing) n=1 Tax=Pyrolobus fumarii (strain DSM 11204 / 1A) TaxID=694429 RepID=G0EDE6_PYRF1|nr:hydantoinase B/oxoprolinase family protein [Pyrolobus fumarii]AEM38631.1 5-oxoprolinase (ATP-hydrolyzing) [Pyrolobus fumarii 1A]